MKYSDSEIALYLKNYSIGSVYICNIVLEISPLVTPETNLEASFPIAWIISWLGHFSYAKDGTFEYHHRFAGLTFFGVRLTAGVKPAICFLLFFSFSLRG